MPLFTEAAVVAFAGVYGKGLIILLAVILDMAQFKKEE